MLLGSGEQSYGLDPAVLDAVQNGAGPDGMPLAPAPSYGLPPELVPALQNGFASPAPAPMPMAAAQPPIPSVESPTGIAPAPIASSTSRNTPPTSAAAGKPAPAPSNEATIAKADAARAGEIQNQAQITDQQGQVAAQEAQDVYAAKQTGLAAAEAKQKEADAKAAAWQQRVQTAAQNFDQATTNEANYKVDENRRWNNTSTGSKVLAGIGVLLAGVGGALTHQGGNAALQIIQDSIKEDVANQWKQKDALGRQIGYAKGRLDNYRQLAGDDAQAQQLQVASEYKKVADQIDLAASKFAAPQAKARAQLASSQLRAQAQQVIGNAAEQSTAREQRAQEMKNQTAQVGIAAGHLALSREQLDEQKHQFNEGQKMEMLKLAMSGQLQSAQALQKQTEEINDRGVFVPSGTSTDAQGNTQASYAPALQEDGKTPWLIPKGREKDTQEAMAAADKGVQAIDSLRAMRHQGGGDVFNTADSRLKEQELARALIALHEAGGIKRFSGEIVDLMQKKLTGGGDVHSLLQSIMPNLDKARSDLIEDKNLTARGANYTGKEFEYPDPLDRPQPPLNATQEQVKQLLEYNPERPTKAESKNLGHSTIGGGDVLPPAYKQTIDDMRAILANPKTTAKARDQTAEYLQQLSTKSSSKQMRDYAMKAATSGPMESIPLESEGR